MADVCRNVPTSIFMNIDMPASFDVADCLDDEYEIQRQNAILMKSERNRLDSFRTWTSSSPQPASLARAGLYFTGTGDRVQCAFCHGVLKNWQPHDEAFSEHRRFFPRCPFLLGQDVQNIPIGPSINVSINPVPINHNNPPFGATSYANFGVPDYTIELNRLKSFAYWPRHLVQKPDVLARAGFYHFRSDDKPDRVKCAYCKGKLYNWQKQDDPWIEHARNFYNCGYINMCMGEDVVRDLRSSRPESRARHRCLEDEEKASPVHSASTPVSHQQSTSGDDVTKRMQSESVQAVIDMGFNKDTVRRVVEKCTRELSGADLASLVLELEQSSSGAAAAAASATVTSSGPGHVQHMATNKLNDKVAAIANDPAKLASIRDENSRLRDQYVCKICMENEVRMTFMPCGHLACCGPCSQTVTNCPICRTDIKGSVMTFF